MLGSLAKAEINVQRSFSHNDPPNDSHFLPWNDTAWEMRFFPFILFNVLSSG